MITVARIVRVVYISESGNLIFVLFFTYLLIIVFLLALVLIS